MGAPRAWLLSALLPLLAGAAAAAPQDGGGEAPEPSLQLRVNHAILRGVQNLRGHQAAEGLWRGNESAYPGGLTALVCYTLLKSGVRRDDPALGKGLRVLAGTPPQSTYGSAVRLLLYETLPREDAWRRPAEECVDLLLRGQKDGLWAYPWGKPDMSNVQFALLGLRAARLLGLVVPEEALSDCARALWRDHVADAGFRYKEGDPATGGITAATLGGLAVLEEFAELHPEIGQELRRRKRDHVAAHEWMVAHWNPARNAHGRDSWTPSHLYAYLWAVERYCDLTGRERLGEHDWYAEGSEFLVADQHANGSWGRTVDDTCFALLFLRRAIFSGGPELEELYGKLDESSAEREASGPPPLQKDAPWLRDWLVAGPWQGTLEETGLGDPPFRPARVHAREGAKLDGKTWQRFAFPDGEAWTNLDVLTGAMTEQCLWALATDLAVPADDASGRKEPIEAVLWFTFEDGWRVFLDGAEVSSERRVRAAIVPDVRVPVRLVPGETHELLVLLEDVIGAAAFAARLSGLDGRPLSTPVEAAPSARARR